MVLFLFSVYSLSEATALWMLSLWDSESRFLVCLVYLSHFHLLSLSFSGSWEIQLEPLNALVEGFGNNCYWYHHFHFQELFVSDIFKLLLIHGYKNLS